MPSFTLDELPAFQEWIRKGCVDGAKRGALSAAMRGVEIITTELIPGENPPPIFMRAYAAGWRAEATLTGADMVNTVPYASIVEWGARPENIKIGKAMIEALTNWVLVKGLVGKTTTKNRAEQTVQARQVAWAIALHMKKVGIFNRNGNQGLRIGERALKRVREFIGPEIKREIQRELGG